MHELQMSGLDEAEFDLEMAGFSKHVTVTEWINHRVTKLVLNIITHVSRIRLVIRLTSLVSAVLPQVILYE